MGWGPSGGGGCRCSAGVGSSGGAAGKLVDDRVDASGSERLEVHQQVVAHQVERHREDGGRDAVEVDFAAVVGALVDDLVAA